MGTTILNSLAPVFFVLGLGYFAGRWKMADNKNVHSINIMLMNFAVPCALFLAIARATSKVLAQQYRLVVALGLAMICIYWLTWILQRWLFHLQPNEAAVQSLTV